MNTMTMTQTTRGFTLRQLLGFDAVTCFAFGVLLLALSAPLAGLLGLPETLLFYAGVVLFPCAALMVLAARTLTRPLVWTVIIGNFAWSLASVVVAFAFDTTPFGLAFLVGQAALVAVLGVMEMRAAK
jgi:hypothetical protein